MTRTKWERHDASNMEEARRAIQLWNEINLSAGIEAQLHMKEGIVGWERPQVKGERLSDAQISAAILETFRKTGRILLDAILPGNLVKTPGGQVVCADISRALLFDKKKDAAFAQIDNGPIISEKNWAWVHMGMEASFAEGANNPQAVAAVKALLYIRMEHPESSKEAIYQILTEKPTNIALCAAAYDKRVRMEQMNPTPNPQIVAQAASSPMHHAPRAPVSPVAAVPAAPQNVRPVARAPRRENTPQVLSEEAKALLYLKGHNPNVSEGELRSNITSAEQRAHLAGEFDKAVRIMGTTTPLGTPETYYHDAFSADPALIPRVLKLYKPEAPPPPLFSKTQVDNALNFLKGTKPHMNESEHRKYLEQNRKEILEYAEQYESALKKAEVYVDNHLQSGGAAKLSGVLENPEKVIFWAQMYDKAVSPSPQPVAKETALEQIEEELKPQDQDKVEAAKNRCIEVLQQYINSRGAINKQDGFDPSWRTKFFRDEVLTGKKVAAARELIQKIRGVNSMDDLKNVMGEAQKKAMDKEPNLSKAGFLRSSGYKSCLGQCNLVIDKIEKANLELGVKVTSQLGK